ncbi:hypothetical protein KCP77_08740 [Salmonella enterica subsp. enterica]|nr:hypothetical protein KCP77_08740 [Salmonella enterica subsp. enterica]
MGISALRHACLTILIYPPVWFNDSHAINPFSAYAPLTLPLFWRLLADRLLGNRVAVITGALLMTLGHVVLG